MQKRLIFQLILPLFFLFFSIPAFCLADNLEFTPQITIPNSAFVKNASTTVSSSTETIAEYIKAVYKYLIGMVGILGAIMLTFGGVKWLTAGGDSGKVNEAKEIIQGSLTGLSIALLSFLILGLINPDLVNFRIQGISTIKGNTLQKSSSQVSGEVTGCCNFTASQKCGVVKKSECKGAWFGENYECKNGITCTEKASSGYVACCICGGTPTNFTQLQLDIAEKNGTMICDVVKGGCKYYSKPCSAIK